jgi:hypothetical protein
MVQELPPADYSLIKSNTPKPQSTNKESEMYGPVAMQVHSGSWEHEALREAKGHRRGHTDTDYLKDMDLAHQHATVIRLIAAAATVLVALAVIVLI